VPEVDPNAVAAEPMLLEDRPSVPLVYETKLGKVAFVWWHDRKGYLYVEDQARNRYLCPLQDDLYAQLSTPRRFGIFGLRKSAVRVGTPVSFKANEQGVVVDVAVKGKTV
jgi:hypothetical protein